MSGLMASGQIISEHVAEPIRYPKDPADRTRDDLRLSRIFLYYLRVILSVKDSPIPDRSLSPH